MDLLFLMFQFSKWIYRQRFDEKALMRAFSIMDFKCHFIQIKEVRVLVQFELKDLNTLQLRYDQWYLIKKSKESFPLWLWLKVQRLGNFPGNTMSLCANVIPLTDDHLDALLAWKIFTEIARVICFFFFLFILNHQSFHFSSLTLTLNYKTIMVIFDQKS